MLLLCRDLTATLVHIVLVMHPLNIWCFTMSFGRHPRHTLHTTFWCSTQTHIHLVLAGSVTVPHLQSWPGRGIRPFPLMKLSEELTAKHRALLICSTLLLSVVLFKTFSSHCFSFTRPLCPFFLSSLFSSPSLLLYPFPSSCSSPSHLPSNYFSVCLPLHVVLTFSCLLNRQLIV